MCRRFSGDWALREREKLYLAEGETELRCSGHRASSDPMEALELGWPITVVPKQGKRQNP